MAHTQIGENVSAEVKDGKLHLTIDLSVKGSPSSTGKTTVLAKTFGPTQFPGGSGEKLNLQLFRKA